MNQAPWAVMPLEAVCVPSGLVRGPFGGSLKKIDFVASGYRVYEQRHAINGTLDGARYFVDAKKFQEMKRFSVRPGDFIVSCSGTIGRIYQLPKSSPEGIINQALLKVTVDTRIIEPQFFTSYFEWDRFQEKILESTQGGAMQNLVGMATFRKVPFIVPPLQEQRRIAEALRDSSELIGVLKRLIAKKQAIKQGMMQQLLTGKTRLSGFSGEWVAVAAGDIASFRGGSGFPIRYQARKSGAYPFFKVSDMNNEGNELFMRRANNYISADTRKLIGAVVMPKDAIVFAKVGAAVFLERKRILGQVSCIDNNMAAMTVDPLRADVRFVHYLLMNFSMSSLVSTTALPSLNGGQLRSIPVRLPSEIAEQRAIADLLADADAELDLLQTQLSKARLVKQGMMQELLTGRTRLKPVEVTV